MQPELWLDLNKSKVNPSDNRKTLQHTEDKVEQLERLRSEDTPPPPPPHTHTHTHTAS